MTPRRSHAASRTKARLAVTPACSPPKRAAPNARPLVAEEAIGLTSRRAAWALFRETTRRRKQRLQRASYGIGLPAPLTGVSFWQTGKHFVDTDFVLLLIFCWVGGV